MELSANSGIKKYGYMVWMNLNNSSIADMYSCVIPIEYRPTHDVEMPVKISAQGGNQIYFGTCRVNTTGKMVFYTLPEYGKEMIEVLTTSTATVIGTLCWIKS